MNDDSRDDEDPAGRSAPPTVDLHEVSEWNPTSPVDKLVVVLHRLLIAAGKVALVGAALVLLFVQLAVSGLELLTNPWVGTLTLLSALPAVGLAVIVWYWDISTSEPLSLLAATFLLGVSFASIAAVVNTFARPAFTGTIPFGVVAFYYVVVAPGEELVKLAAVRVYAFADESFDAVIDGSVYGASSGLGFAVVENLIYINRQYRETLVTSADVVPQVVGVAALRTFAGPGHVIYTAIAGYYLGLAKFNPDSSGEIVLKGVLIAVVAHATYNSLVGVVSQLIQSTTGLPPFASFVLFAAVYDSIAFLLLYRLLAKYRTAYRSGPPRRD